MELLGVSDVAALLDEPDHVVNIACSRFATFIPMVRIGRDRWYPPEAVPVLRVIFDQIRVGVPDEHIETVLTKRFPVTRIASQDLVGQADAPARPQPQAEARAEQVRDVFDRYQSTIQNEMLQMRRELAQIAPQPAPAPPPRPEMSLSELARQDGTSQYIDPRAYGFTHVDDQPAQRPVEYRLPPMPQPEREVTRATNADFEDGLSEDAKTVLSAISRQAAASETAALRNEVESMRSDLGALVEQFRSFSQQLGVYQDVREQRPRPQQPSQAPAAAAQPTRLEVVQHDRDRDAGYAPPPYNNHVPTAEQNGNGLLGQLTKRSPRRMGRTLLTGEEQHHGT